MSRWGSLLSGKLTNVVSGIANVASIAVEQGAHYLESIDGQFDADGAVDDAVKENARRATQNESVEEAELFAQQLDQQEQEREAEEHVKGNLKLQIGQTEGAEAWPTRDGRPGLALDDLGTPSTAAMLSPLPAMRGSVGGLSSVTTDPSTSPFDFASYGASLESAVKEKEDEIQKLRKLVEALKANKAAVLQEQMQPQLQRLVFILQDTQDKIRQKDHEISRLKAQLLAPGGMEPPSSPRSSDQPVSSQDMTRLARGDERMRMLADKVDRLTYENESLKRTTADTQELLQAKIAEKDALAAMLRKAEEGKIDHKRRMHQRDQNLARVNAERVGLETRAEKAEERCRALQQAMEQLEHQLADARDAMDRLGQGRGHDGKLDNKLRSRIVELEERDAETLRELDRLRGDLGEVVRQRDEALADAEKRVGEVWSQAEGRIAALEEALAAAKEHAEVAASRVHAESTDEQRLGEEVFARLDVVERERDDAILQLKAARQDCDALRAVAEQALAEGANRSSEVLSEAEAVRQALAAELDASTKERDEALHQLKAAQHELQTLRSDLQHTQADGELRGAEDRVQALNAQLHALVNQKDEAVQRVQAVEEEFNAFRASSAAVYAEAQSASSQACKDVEEEKRSLLMQLDAANVERVAAAQHLASVRQELDAIKTTVEVAQTKSDTQAVALQGAERQTTSLAAQLEALSTDRDEAWQTIKALRQELETARSSAEATHVESQSSLQKALQAAEEEKHVLLRQLEAASQEFESYKTSVEQTEAQSQSRLAQARQEAEKQIMSLAAQLDAVSNERKEAWQTVMVVRQELEMVRTSAESAQAESQASLQGKLNQVEKEKQELRDERDAASQQLAALRREFDEFKTTAEWAQAHNQSLSAEAMAGAEKQITSLAAQLDALTNERDETWRTLQALRSELQTVRASAEASEAQSTSLQHEGVKAADEKKDLVNQLQDAALERDTLLQELRVVKQEADTFKASVEQARRQVESQSAEALLLAQEHIQALADQLEAISTERDEMRQELQAAHHAVTELQASRDASDVWSQSSLQDVLKVAQEEKHALFTRLDGLVHERDTASQQLTALREELDMLRAVVEKTRADGDFQAGEALLLAEQKSHQLSAELDACVRQRDEALQQLDAAKRDAEERVTSAERALAEGHSLSVAALKQTEEETAGMMAHLDSALRERDAALEESANARRELEAVRATAEQAHAENIWQSAEILNKAQEQTQSYLAQLDGISRERDEAVALSATAREELESFRLAADRAQTDSDSSTAEALRVADEQRRFLNERLEALSVEKTEALQQLRDVQGALEEVRLAAERGRTDSQLLKEEASSRAMEEKQALMVELQGALQERDVAVEESRVLREDLERLRAATEQTQADGKSVAEDAIAQLEAVVREDREAIEELRATLDDVRRALLDATAQRDEARAAVEAARSEVDKALQDKSEALAALHQLQDSAADEAARAIADLQAQLQETRGILEHATIDRNEARAAAHQVETEASRLQEENDWLKGRADGLCEEIGSLREHLRMAVGEKEAAMSALADTHRSAVEVDGLQRQLEAIRLSVEEATRGRDEAVAALEEMRSALEQLGREKEGADTGLRELRAEFERSVLLAMAEKQEQLEDAQAVTATVTAELKQAEASVVRLTAEMDGMKAQLDAAQQQADNLQSALIQAQDRLRRVEAEADEARVYKQQADRALLHAQAERDEEVRTAVAEAESRLQELMAHRLGEEQQTAFRLHEVEAALEAAQRDRDQAIVALGQARENASGEVDTLRVQSRGVQGELAAALVTRDEAVCERREAEQQRVEVLWKAAEQSAEAQMQMEALRAAVETKHAEAEGIRARLRELEANLEGRTKQTRALEEQLVQVRRAAGEQAVAHEAEVFRARKELEQLRDRASIAAQMEEEVQRLRNKRRADMDELRRLNEHVRSLQMKHAADLREIVEDRDASATSLHEAMTEGERLRAEADVLRAEIEALRPGVAGAQQQAPSVTESGSTNSLANSTEGFVVVEEGQPVEELKARLQALETEITSLRTQLTEAQGDSSRMASELTRRLQAAESARDSARREAAGLRADLAVLSSATATGPATVFQRAPRGGHGRAMGDVYDVEGGMGGRGVECWNPEAAVLVQGGTAGSGPGHGEEAVARADPVGGAEGVGTRGRSYAAAGIPHAAARVDRGAYVPECTLPIMNSRPCVCNKLFRGSC